MIAFLVVYGLIIFAAAFGLAYRPDYFGNVGFLIIGILTGIYPAFVIEEWRRWREERNLTIAVFYELANRVARCCYDFEKPWHSYLKNPEGKSVFNLRKFVPEPPVIYPAIAPRIAILANDAPPPIIQFYIQLSAWRRDVENTANAWPQHGRSVPQEAIAVLAKRLRQTLESGHDAIEKLAGQVPNAIQIELDAISRLDKQNPDPHLNAGKALRERIRIMLSETKQHES